MEITMEPGELVAAVVIVVVIVIVLSTGSLP
jgi:hypothetical protein